ncbi:hypothetical protein [Bacillus sp. CECT 9360]|uniref:hypothetical protein n=1 Tax=Bacillus sp. CECT 9360 TaxID=2845821 RepID=UPI001E2BAE53|nr:hypothetical protein [Bacillus sp. CECT 9360]CAH0347015.1 hypothetical protein BCI9360_03388 [Bacillus sp. CECT 9360]
MKRLLLFLTLCFIGFIIYFDLTTGTLPASGVKAGEYSIQPEKSSVPYTEVMINPGDTLLTISEKEEDGLTVSIEMLIRDFQELNNGLNPEEMQIGETYKIPVYDKQKGSSQ